MRTHAGGGGRIVVNPAELRRGAKRLRGLGADLRTFRGRLRGATLPAMPSDLIGPIRSGVEEIATLLDSIPPPLEESAVELERRALWAEIADELIAGVPLSGTQLRQFMEGLRDGTLVRYAESWQAELAGAYVAGKYADTYKDPDELIELARILQANDGAGEASGAFYAGFVERFGSRIADIPRVIQAMEWTPSMSLGGYDDPFVDFELGRQLAYDGYELPVDPVELLGAFAIALAMGTASGRVSASVEHEIAWDEDRWAVAQLMHKGMFGANFLKEAFQSIVVSDIQRDAVRFGPDMTAYMQIGMGDNEGPSIATDERELVLRALLLNGEGAALALSAPLPDEVYIASRWAPVETRDPVAVLYAADWDDDGRLFADVYREATTWAQSEAPTPGTSRQGNEITLQLIERASNEYRGDLGAVTDALAEDIARHHVRSLLEMNLPTSAGGADGDVGKGLIDLTSHRIVLDARQVEELVNSMSERTEADRIFVRGLAEGQAAYLAEMVREHPEDGELWGGRVGALNQLVLNAHDVERTIEFGHASDQQKLAMSLLGTTFGALSEGTPYGLLVDPLMTAVDIGTGPSALELANSNFADKLDTRELVKAVIATAAYEYGDVPGPSDAQKPYLLENGRLISYSRDLPDAVRNEFNQWVEVARARDERLDDALIHALQAMDDYARN